MILSSKPKLVHLASTQQCARAVGTFSFAAAALCFASSSQAATPQAATPQAANASIKGVATTSSTRSAAKAVTAKRVASKAALSKAVAPKAAAPKAVASKAVASTRIAQGPIVSGTNETNTPAALPNEPENPNKLEIPVGPDDDATTTPDAAATDAAAAPAAEVPPPIVSTPTLSLPTEDPIPTDLEGRVIANVRVVGNRVISTEAILGQVVGTKTGGALSAPQVQSDKRRIDTLGFFAAVQQQVTPNLDDLDKVDVAFIVVENRAITGFAFEDSGRIKAPDLEAVLESKVGTVLNRNSINRDVEKLQGLYTERGLAALVTESRQDADGKVIFVLQELKVSKVVLIGLKKTKEALVRSQIRTRPGDVLDQIAIRGDLNRIFDTGFFEDLSYRIADDTTTPGSIIVNITMKEKRTGQFGVGVGFDNRSKISGFVSLGESNFRGTGQRVSASVELGAQRTFELGTGSSYVGKNNASSYDVSIFNRLIFREPRTVSAVLGEPTNIQYQEKRTGGRFNYIKPLNENRDTSLIFGFRAESARLFQANDQVLVPIDLPQASSGRVVAASAGYISDKRDLRLDPSSGSRRQIIVEQALGVLGSSSRFTKIDLDVRRYFPLIGAPKSTAKGEIPLPRLVLASRLAYGKSFGDLPAFEQYFVGGTDTVRGYESDEQFGDNQFYSNLELRYRINRQFTPVFFVDAGKAYGGRFSSAATDELLYSVGVGIRVKTPLGPVRFDLARGRRGVKTHFGIGSTF